MPFAPRHHEDAEKACRELAANTPWSTVILESWPAPFAFEYWRLREELARGQLLAAMFQLKDCAEVLLKLVVSMAGRLLIEQGERGQQQQARQFLLANKSRSMGDWANEGVKLIDAVQRLPKDAWQPWTPVWELLRNPRNNPQTPLAKELIEIVGWRNHELGHGALKLDLMDFINTDDGCGFEVRLRQFNNSLVRYQSAWDAIRLVAVEGDREAVALTGYEALTTHAEALADMLSQRALLPLTLQRDMEAQATATLSLGPYVCLRRQSRRDEVGCYVLNKRIGKRHAALLNLLDYRTGDTGSVGRASGEESLTAELNSLPEEVTEIEAVTPVGDIQDREVREFLDQMSFQREYVSPEYLRRELSAFMDSSKRDRGLFWLCGPADVGKTFFSYSLATCGALSHILGDERPAPVVEDLVVIVIPIRREYRGTPAALSSDVQQALDRSGRDHFMGLERFLYDPQYLGNGLPGAFCEWLKLMRNEATTAYGKAGRLLLVLDGLDELPKRDAAVEGGSIADLLPPADLLPERVFLLLTSRGREAAQPLDACPEPIYTALDSAFAASAAPLRQRYDLDPLHNADYRAIVETFFTQRLPADLKQDPAQHAALFAQVLERSEYRFKTVSYFTALLASQVIQPADVATISTKPLQQHLVALERWEPPRKFALIRRILLELAAAEQAHQAEIRWMEPAPVIDRHWLGLDVLELAGRVGYPATQPHELDPRFLAALYSVRELVRSYRGAEAATSRFALGLKGMLEQLAMLDGWDTTDTLQRLMQEALSDYRSNDNEEVETAALIRLGGPTAALVDGGVRIPCWEGVEPIFWACTNRANSGQEVYRTAEALRLCVTARALALLAMHPDEPEATQITLRNVAAGALLTRGNVWQSRHQFNAAIADYDKAITVRKALRADLEPQGRWETGLRNDLAGAYMNRGTAKQHASEHGPSAAIADYNEAITVMEALRADLEPQGRWETGLRNDLAGAYMNRGNAKQHASEHGPSAAIADYDKAIAVRKALRADLEPQGRWETGLRNDLAGAYMNRGNAKQDASEHGPSAAIADYDKAIAVRKALRADLEPQGRWETGLRNDLAGAYMNRGNAKQDASEHGPSAAIADYDKAIAVRKALRADLEPQGRWETGLRNDLAGAYMNRGNACYRLEDVQTAITQWAAAAEIYPRVTETSLSLGSRWLQAIFSQLLGHLTLNEMALLAQHLLEFMVIHQQLESRWAAHYDAIEPPWREIVTHFARIVHSLSPEQRAAVLDALGENAEAVKHAFGWD